MSNSIRADVANAIAQQLLPTELSIDETLEHLSLLTVAMVRGRARAGVSVDVGRSAFDHLGEATTHAFKLRHHLVRAHGGLASVRDDLDIPAVMYGSSLGCPDKDTERGMMPGSVEVELDVPSRS